MLGRPFVVTVRAKVADKDVGDELPVDSLWELFHAAGELQ